MRIEWMERREESRLRRLALMPLAPLSWLYAAAAAGHRALYRCGLWRARRLPCRVISVGNLVVGGTAKTPFAAWLAAMLRERGRKVVLVSRGYRRADTSPVYVVSDGRRVCGSVEAAGDEPMLLAARAPGVPVLVGRDRGLVGLRAVTAFGAEVIVLDDGFQHHRLARDVDLVLFDGRLGLGNRRTLPRGPLRESLRALRHADAIGVVDGPLPEADEARIARAAPHARRFRAERRPAELRSLRDGSIASPDVLDGEEIGMLAALAQPRGFRRTLEKLGARVIAERVFRDHHTYRAADLRGLARAAPRWVTTQKDAVKILPSWVGEADLRVLAIDLAVADAQSLVDWLDARLG
jgi:tetraacyldisaccharide 4'-kinase